MSEFALKFLQFLPSIGVTQHKGVYLWLYVVIWPCNDLYEYSSFGVNKVWKHRCKRLSRALRWRKLPGLPTPTQYVDVVHISYGPHTPLSVYWGWYFSAPDTHVLCMGSRTATGIFQISVVILNSILHYQIFNVQIWYWLGKTTRKLT